MTEYNGPGKRLYKSSRDRMIDGVCAGIAEYFGIDSIWVRMIWLFGTIALHGLGVPVYIFLAFLVPYRPGDVIPASRFPGEISPKLFRLGGIILVVFGVYALLANFNMIPPAFYRFVALARQAALPLLLIFIGIYLIGRKKDR